MYNVGAKHESKDKNNENIEALPRENEGSNHRRL